MASLEPIIARLKASASSLGGRVAGAGEFRGVEGTEADVVKPMAFVVPLANSRKDSSDAPVTLELAHVVAVYLIADPVDNRGQTGAEQVLKTLGPEVITALDGWQPEAAAMPMRYLAGELERQDRAVYWWRFDFQLEEQVS